MNVNEIATILKALVPVVLGKYFPRIRDAALSEFVKKVEADPEPYTFDNGDEEAITWTHFLFGEDVVIGIGKRGEKLKSARSRSAKRKPS